MTNLLRRRRRSATTLWPRLRRISAPAVAATTLLVAAAVAVNGTAPSAARADDWPVLGGGVTRTNVAPEAVKTPLSLLWAFTGAPQTANPCAPVVAGNIVYYAARGTVNGPGRLFAIDTRTGSQIWHYDLQGNNLFQSAPTLADGNLYIGASNGNVYVLDAQTGHEIHPPFQTARSINSAPTVEAGVVYFGSGDGSLYAFDTQSLAPVWKAPFRAGDSINSAPILAGGYIYVTTDADMVIGVKQGTGQARWAQRIPYRILPNAPVYADSALYVPANQRVYALLANSGGVRWARDLPGDVLAAPAAESGVLYCLAKKPGGVDGAQVWAIRTANGKNYWDKPADLDITPSAAPTIAGDVIFVPTIKNVLYALSKDDGHVLWQYHFAPTAAVANLTLPPTTALTTPITVSNGGVYVLTDDGSLSAFRSDAPDQSPPLVTTVYPDAAQRVNGNPPFTLAAFLIDPGTGIDPSTVKLKLDGQPVETQFDADRGLAYYVTKTSAGAVQTNALPQGRHEAELTAADWKGNVRTDKWSFVVDNTVAPATRASDAPVTTSRPTATKPSTAAPGGNRGGAAPAGGGGGRRGRRGGNGNGL